MYDKNIFKSTQFGIPIISVGNLSVGGTGKSPMVEYLVMHLKDKWKVATLSRGYKRKTRGYALARASSTALDIGDEPMQFYRKFPDVPVAVGEERLVAVPQLLHDHPETQAIILDDAFQHRAIKAGYNILLTEYANLFTRDFFLPTGDLRDQTGSYKRADVIIVTKCPGSLSSEERAEITKEIDPQPGQHLYFTTIVYGSPYHITRREFGYIDENTEVLLVTGIANPRPLKEFLENRVHIYTMMHFGDHHIFTIDDWREMVRKFEKIEGKKMLLTTEKDAMRLLKFESEIGDLPLYVIPIEHTFLFNEADAFEDNVFKFIQNFKKPS